MKAPLKAVSAAIVAILVSAGISPAVAAAPIIYSSGGFDYRVINSTSVSIVHCTGWQSGGSAACPSSNAVIPASIDQKAVTQIDDDAFASGGLTSLTLPDSLIVIGKRAFAGNKIKNLVLPNKLQRINEGAFDMASYSDSELKTLKPVLTVPESVNFVGHRSLPKVWEIRFLGDAPIGGDSDIFDVGSANSLAPNKVSAFYTKKGWAHGGSSGFYNAHIALVAPENTLVYKDLDYQVGTDGKITIIFCDPGASGTHQCPAHLVIPDTINGKQVAKIGDGAFFRDDITSVSLPKGLVSIGKDAFALTGITQVNFPNSLTSIGAGAFNNSDNVEPYRRWVARTTTIPSSVTFIGKDALSGLGETQVIRFLGDAPATDSVNIFEARKPLKIYASANKTGWTSHSFSGQQVTLDTDPATQATYGSVNGLDWRLQVDDSIQITSCTGWSDPFGSSKPSCPKKSYVIPQTIAGKDVTSIGDAAFAFSQLKSIQWPSTITSIGAQAFDWGNSGGEDRSYLSSLVLPPNLRTLGNSALSGFVVDKPLQVPATVTSVGVSSFPSVDTVNFLGDAPSVKKDPTQKWTSPFIYRFVNSNNPMHADTEYVTALGGKTGWQTRSLAGTHVTLDTDPMPELPKAKWAILKGTCKRPPTWIVFAVKPVSNVSFKVKTSQRLSSIQRELLFGKPGTTSPSAISCLPLAKLKAPAGWIIFEEFWDPTLSYSLLPISDLGARGPEYAIKSTGKQKLAAGSAGSN